MFDKVLNCIFFTIFKLSLIRFINESSCILRRSTKCTLCFKSSCSSPPISIIKILVLNFSHSLQVKRLQSTNARSWALKYIPPLLRESLIHQASVILSHNAVAKFWSILYSPQLYHVAIPNDLGRKFIFHNH